MTSARLSLALVVAAALFVPDTATADEALRVAPPVCATLPFDYTSFDSLLRIELQESHVSVAPAGVSTLFIDVSGCDASGATPVTLTFSGPPARSRAVALADVEPAVRPRVLALAAAEFVTSSIRTRQPTPVDSAPAISPPAPTVTQPVSAATPTLPWSLDAAAPASAPKPRMRPFTATAAFALRSFPIDETSLAGLELRGSIKLTGMLRLRTAVLGLYARDDGALGTIHLAGGAGAIGLSLGARGDIVGFDIGPRLDVGGLLLEGHAAPGAALLTDDKAAPFVCLGLDAEADFYVTPGFLVVAAIEAGGALASVTGNGGGVRAIGASGPFFGLRLGLGIAP